MNTRLAKKIAQQYINAQQPLRLQPDYGERNAADFLGDRSVARNTGYGENLKAGPGNAYDEVVAENFADFLGDEDLMSEIISDLEADETESFEIIDDLDEDEIIDDLGRMAEFWKESRLPSRKHNPDSVVDKAVAQWREDNPEIAEKFDEEKVEDEEEMNEKMKQADEIIDDLGLSRTASTALLRKVQKLLIRTPLYAELESDYEGTDILIQWDISNVYDEDEADDYDDDNDMILDDDLRDLLHKVFKFVEKKHTGYVEEGTSDIDDGVYRIIIHDEIDYRMASDKTAKLLKRHIKVLEKNLDRLEGIMFYDDIPQDIISDLERVKWTETLHMDVERWLGDHASQKMWGRNRWAKDHEHSGSYMSRQNLKEIDDMADFIVDDIGMEDLDDWVEDKISHAHAAMNDVARYRGYGHRHPHSEDNLKLSKWDKEDIDNFALGLLAESDEDIIDDLEN